MKFLYNIFNHMYLMFAMIVCMIGIPMLPISIFMKILIGVFCGLVTYTYYFQMRNHPKNYFLFHIFIIPGLILINGWYFGIWVLGSLLLSDYITKDGFFEK